MIKRVPSKHPLTAGFVVYPDGREVAVPGGAGKAAYAKRTYQMAQRQGMRCAWCKQNFTEHNPATFDHECGRGSGGSHRDDRIVVDGDWQNAALHLSCNALKGSRRYIWSGGKYIPLDPED